MLLVQTVLQSEGNGLAAAHLGEGSEEQHQCRFPALGLTLFCLLFLLSLKSPSLCLLPPSFCLRDPHLWNHCLGKSIFSGTKTCLLTTFTCSLAWPCVPGCDALLDCLTSVQTSYKSAQGCQRLRFLLGAPLPQNSHLELRMI